MLELVQSNNKFTNLQRDTAELIRDFASVKLPRKNSEGGYNMCKAVMELKQEGIEQGIEQTRLKDIENIKNNLGLSIDKALEILEIPDSERERYKSMLK